MSAALQQAKAVSRAFTQAVDADPSALSQLVGDDYRWRGMRPVYEHVGAQSVIDAWYLPLRRSFPYLQRRETIFLAGENEADAGGIWTCSHGTFMGLFDQDFVGIPAHRKTVKIPYAEFHRIDGERVIESALFVDLIRLQQEVGLDPIPTQTGAKLTPPGPLTRDGVLIDPVDPSESQRTRDLLTRMIDDLMGFNETTDLPSLNILAQTWRRDMAWYGPAGIGTSVTLPRYQEQHQGPFRRGLTDKVFNGHVCRITEGDYCAWFGWPNLNNRNAGRYLGLPKTDVLAEMRVVDIYRRQDDHLAENWVFIDLIHYANQHGVDLLTHPDALHP